MNLHWNKYRLKQQFWQFKQSCRHGLFRLKEITGQVFIPLAVFQLVRTIIFPTPFDVLLLLIIFAVIVFFLIEGM
jgi:hypothetical protein